MARRRLVYLAVTATALVASVPALAALPSVSTGGAKSITSTSVTLTGTVNPNNEPTTIWFEYGTTKAYGSRTDMQGGITGKTNTPVSANVAGLTPATTYHYRLVAVNASGTKAAGDKTFKTPAGITLGAFPLVPFFPHPVTLSGQLSGTAIAGVKVTLQANPYPFPAGGFRAIATTTTDAHGLFSFAQTPMLHTSYQAVADTKPKATSAAVVVHVRFGVSVSLSTAHPKRNTNVRFSGFVQPSHDGALVRIQRRVATGWRTVKTGLLRAAAGEVSNFSVRVRVRRSGVYRAYVSGDAAHLAGWSRRRVISVR